MMWDACGCFANATNVGGDCARRESVIRAKKSPGRQRSDWARREPWRWVGSRFGLVVVVVVGFIDASCSSSVAAGGGRSSRDRLSILKIRSSGGQS